MKSFLLGGYNSPPKNFLKKRLRNCCCFAEPLWVEGTRGKFELMPYYWVGTITEKNSLFEKYNYLLDL